jgi:hypothetical protein
MAFSALVRNAQRFLFRRDLDQEWGDEMKMKEVLEVK